ncbi:FRG domain-containing protein [Klebsiella aerogenes]
MEDSDDPLVSLFGRVRLDLSMGYNYNLADLLNTLLQHYGLFSPYLDLSSDLRVAMFFASGNVFCESSFCSQCWQ